MKKNTIFLISFLSFISVLYGESLVARSEYSGNKPRDTTNYEVGYGFKNGSTFKQADYNDDCSVDMLDLATQTDKWLIGLDCEDIDCDLNADCDIDLEDFAKLTGQLDKKALFIK